MSREVFGRRDHAGRLVAAQGSETESSDGVRVVAEGAGPDHRVGGLKVDVEDGREIHRDPDVPQLPAGDERAAFRRARIAGRRLSHWARDGDERLWQAADSPALLVSGDQERR